jgi:hypothetical protein
MLLAGKAAAVLQEYAYTTANPQAIRTSPSSASQQPLTASYIACFSARMSCKAEHHTSVILCATLLLCLVPAAYSGLRVDVDRVRADNEAQVDAHRKNGLVIWTGREHSSINSSS